MTPDELAPLLPCPDGLRYLRQVGSLERAWAETDNGAWMAWWLGKVPPSPRIMDAIEDCVRLSDAYETRDPQSGRYAITQRHVSPETRILWAHAATGFHRAYLPQCAEVLRLWFPSPPSLTVSGAGLPNHHP